MSDLVEVGSSVSSEESESNVKSPTDTARDSRVAGSSSI